MEPIDIRRERMDAPAAVDLLSELDAELDRRYCGGEPVEADAAEFLPPGGQFVIAYVDGQPTACGGYRRLDDTTAELKRMYVREQERRRGLARAVLTTLEADARDAGYTAMCLETGAPQFEAIALYPRAGYTPIDSFGQFAGSPTQRCYGKSLV